jgi:hypothetical protein
MSEANKGVICSARFPPPGIASTASNPSLSPGKVNRGIIGDFYFQMSEPGLPERGQKKIKIPYERAKAGRLDHI